MPTKSLTKELELSTCCGICFWALNQELPIQRTRWENPPMRKRLTEFEALTSSVHTCSSKDCPLWEEAAGIKKQKELFSCLPLFAVWLVLKSQPLWIPASLPVTIKAAMLVSSAASEKDVLSAWIVIGRNGCKFFRGRKRAGHYCPAFDTRNLNQREVRA